MLSTDQLNEVSGGTVYGPAEEKLGSIGQFYVDDKTGQPEWVTVHTGLFGTRQSFVPLAQAETRPDGLAVPYDKNTVKGAPSVDTDGHLSEQEETELYRHYGLTGSGQPGYGTSDDTRDGRQDMTGQAGIEGRDTSGPTTDDAMTRSEEQLRAGTQTVETGRARLRKYVVTETQQVSVPVSREEVRLEREPITEANRGPAMAGGDITEEEHEVTLHAERPVVQTEAVPVERVRLGTETVTGTETVSGEVRKEQIELDDSSGTSDKGRRSKR